MKINKILEKYNFDAITVGVLGSHSALDICHGAKKLGFRTLVIAQIGRDKTYNKYYKTRNEAGCVDECMVLDKFSDLFAKSVQKQLQKRNTIFVPHRSFEVYLNFDYEKIENKFKLPMFGNRNLLKIEERGISPNQYDLLKAAHISYPKIFSDPRKIDRLCLVKVLEKTRGFERAFFLVKSFADYKDQVEKNLKEGKFTKSQLKNAVVEEFILGVHVNFNFFYSPISRRLELLGTDTRRQTNLEGLLCTPAVYQSDILKNISIKYEEAGHVAVTVLESLLESAYELGERFVRASRKLFYPGVIGPFALQSIITPGPPKKDIVVFDVSPRVPGSPGISSTPYANYLFGKSMSVGERIAMEIKQAVKLRSLKKTVT